MTSSTARSNGRVIGRACLQADEKAGESTSARETCVLPELTGTRLGVDFLPRGLVRCGRCGRRWRRTRRPTSRLCRTASIRHAHLPPCMDAHTHTMHCPLPDVLSCRCWHLNSTITCKKSSFLCFRHYPRRGTECLSTCGTLLMHFCSAARACGWSGRTTAPEGACSHRGPPSHASPSLVATVLYSWTCAAVLNSSGPCRSAAAV